MEPTTVVKPPKAEAAKPARVGTFWLAPCLGAAVEIAKPKAGRFALNGVQVSTMGDTLTVAATDGRRLLRALMDGHEGDDGMVVLLPPEAMAFLTAQAKALPKRASRTDPLVSVSVTEDGPRRLLTLACALTGARLDVREIDGTFPTWEDIIPKPEPVSGFVRLDAPPLTGLLKAMLAVGGGSRDRVAVRVCCRGEKAPVRLDYDHAGIAVVGVLMPVG